MGQSNVERIFEQYIKDTPKQAIVRDMTIKFCTLTNQVQRVCDFPVTNVHITTKVIKKNYDKRPAVENDFLLKKGWKIVHTPDHIYLNKQGKRGDYMFVKSMNNELYVASLELTTYAGEPLVCVVSLFKVPKPRYLESFKLIWSWKGGDPSS